MVGIQLTNIRNCGRNNYYVNGLLPAYIESEDRCIGYVIQIKDIYRSAYESKQHYINKLPGTMMKSVFYNLLIMPHIGFQEGRRLDNDRNGCQTTMYECRLNLVRIWNTSADIGWSRVRNMMIEHNLENWLINPERWWETNIG